MSESRRLKWLNYKLYVIKMNVFIPSLIFFFVLFSFTEWLLKMSSMYPLIKLKKFIQHRFELEPFPMQPMDRVLVCIWRCNHLGPSVLGHGVLRNVHDRIWWIPISLRWRSVAKQANKQKVCYNHCTNIVWKTHVKKREILNLFLFTFWRPGYLNLARRKASTTWAL